MKQSIKTFLLLLILSVTLASNANETYSYTFRFNESDFIFTQVSSDSIIIASKNEPQYYEESAYPAIPFIGRSIGEGISVFIPETISDGKRESPSAPNDE